MAEMVTRRNRPARTPPRRRVRMRLFQERYAYRDDAARCEAVCLYAWHVGNGGDVGAWVDLKMIVGQKSICAWCGCATGLRRNNVKIACRKAGSGERKFECCRCCPRASGQRTSREAKRDRETSRDTEEREAIRYLCSPDLDLCWIICRVCEGCKEACPMLL